MIAPQFPENEKQRQKAVEKYKLLDTLPEESYDNITALMAHICEAPISLITLLDKDRNFLKSHHGVPFSESPRAISFCGHAILAKDDITIIEDARQDDRFHDNPLVAEHQAIFYAGVPLVDPNGFKLGTLCVYDTKPRVLTPQQKDALRAMAKQVIRLFEEHYKNIQLQQLQAKLEQRNLNLEKFAGVVSHDLKSPLAQIRALTELLEQDIKDNLDEDTRQYLDYIKESSESLGHYIDGILKFYKADATLKEGKSQVRLAQMLKEVQQMVNGGRAVQLSITSNTETLQVNQAALMQVFVNLISNAIKYNDKQVCKVQLSCSLADDFYEFELTDNGPGIAKEYQEDIFELFTTASKTDKDGNQSTGIGLATVKKVIENLGGSISLDATPGAGCSFYFSIPA